MDAARRPKGDAKPRTTAAPKRRLLPEEVADGIVERTARGFFRPGQRLIETEVAKVLGVSRLPLREALKTLESQGVVVSTPHRGTRLMEVNEERLNNVNAVRLEIEMLALRTAMPKFRDHPSLLKPMDAVIRAMEKAVKREDRYAAAICDIDFHRALCVASGNPVLVTLWDALERQLTILFGLPWLGYHNLATYLADHRELRRLLAGGNLATARRFLTSHIMEGWRLPQDEPRARRRSRTSGRRSGRRARGRP
jgi:DNA-binding GntR family transcriptional regulator